MIKDGWTGYNQLGSLGFIHEIVRQDYEIGDNLLPSCHRIASLLKRWLLGTHQGAVSHEHLDLIGEHQNIEANFFYRLLQNAAQAEPASFTQIVKNANKKASQKTTAKGGGLILLALKGALFSYWVI